MAQAKLLLKNSISAQALPPAEKEAMHEVGETDFDREPAGPPAAEHKHDGISYKGGVAQH